MKAASPTSAEGSRCSLPPIDIDKKVQVGQCGDELCDGGVDPDPPPDQLYPGQITVPAGCNCRTCGGFCQCRRCACRSPKSSNTSQAVSRGGSESARRGCCGSIEESGTKTKLVGVKKREIEEVGFTGDEFEVDEPPKDDDVEFDQMKSGCCS